MRAPLIAIVFAALVQHGCSKDGSPSGDSAGTPGTISGRAMPGDCLKVSGPAVTRSYDLAALHALRIGGSYDVIVSESATQSVSFEAPAALLDHIDLTVDDGVLTIEHHGCVNLRNAKAVLSVAAPNIDAVELNGSGDVRSTTPIGGDHLAVTGRGSGDFDVTAETGGEVRVEISGSGTATLRGTAGALIVRIDGSGNVVAAALETATADVVIAGSGDADVNASGSVSASITGSGNVTYRGTDEVKQHVSGSGTVRKG